LDPAPTQTDKSKALVLWSRSLELIERMGVVDRFLCAGMICHGARISNGRELIAEISLDAVESRYPYALMIPQSQTEQLLESCVEDCGVRVERRTELVRFAAEDDRVTAVVRDAAGREETVEADWLIGCDGAHSAVRHGLGIE